VGPIAYPCSDEQGVKGRVELIQRADLVLSRKAASRAEIDEAIAELEKALQTAPGFDVHWRLARAYFLQTERAGNKDQQLSYARRGLAHALEAGRIKDDRVESHYYEALNLAKVAEARSSLKMVKPMMAAADRAARIDPAYDKAGPLVFQGKVYITAPAWPVSIGNAERAIDLLKEAVKLAPVPVNRMFLGQAYFHDEQLEAAARELKAALSDSGPDQLEPRWRREAVEYLRRIKNE
jgi:tetratricopeptide (TPR) repeat protein